MGYRLKGSDRPDPRSLGCGTDRAVLNFSLAWLDELEPVGASIDVSRTNSPFLL